MPSCLLVIHAPSMCGRGGRIGGVIRGVDSATRTGPAQPRAKGSYSYHRQRRCQTIKIAAAWQAERN